jgi:ubiquinone/menaquinone biosynthesis C-methylase UbiE
MTHNTPEAVKQYYEDWTDKYIEDFGLFFQAQQTKNPKDILVNLTNVVPFYNGMNVLDAGCGVGGPAIALAKLKKVNIKALTISEVQVKYANENLQKAKWLKGKVNFMQGDFHELPKIFPEAQFDLIYFMESLVHSHNPESVINGARQILKPKGFIYIKDLFKGPTNIENPEIVNFAVNATNEQFCLKIQELGYIINLLNNNGFRIVKCGVPNFKEDFTKGNTFTAKHLFKLLEKQDGPWKDEGLIFLQWLEIVAQKHY